MVPLAYHGGMEETVFYHLMVELGDVVLVVLELVVEEVLFPMLESVEVALILAGVLDWPRPGSVYLDTAK